MNPIYKLSKLVLILLKFLADYTLIKSDGQALDFIYYTLFSNACFMTLACLEFKFKQEMLQKIHYLPFPLNNFQILQKRMVVLLINRALIIIPLTSLITIFFLQNKSLADSIHLASLISIQFVFSAILLILLWDSANSKKWVTTFFLLPIFIFVLGTYGKALNLDFWNLANPMAMMLSPLFFTQYFNGVLAYTGYLIILFVFVVMMLMVRSASQK